MPFFSIIIPVYNTEKYLSKCLNSILYQSFQDFEVLLIDDASDDMSPEICVAFCQQDPRYSYRKKAHAGASEARNLGLHCAKGRYILFVDADDSLDNKLLQKLYDVISDGIYPDLCFMNSHYVVSDQKTLKNTVFNLSKSFHLSQCLSQSEFLDLVTQEGNHIPGSTCLIIANRLFLKKNNLQFDNSLIWSEDSDFTYRSVICASTIKCCNFCGYYYYTGNVTSISKKFSLDKAMGRMDVYIKWAHYFHEDPCAVNLYPKTVREKLVQQFLSEYCTALNMCIINGTACNLKPLYARAKQERSLWKKCQSSQYQEYIRYGLRLGALFRKLKLYIKNFLHLKR